VLEKTCNIKRIVQWIGGGCQAQETLLLQRPLAESYPNTFVVMWKKPVICLWKTFDYGGWRPPHICLGIHYKGSSIKAGEEFKALGGLWAKGVTGALKPEQDFKLNKAYSEFYDLLLGMVPDQSPDPEPLAKFGDY
jgi:hypothetical protein